MISKTGYMIKNPSLAEKFEARFVIVIAIAQKLKSVYNEKVPN